MYDLCIMIISNENRHQLCIELDEQNIYSIFVYYLYYILLYFFKCSYSVWRISFCSYKQLPSFSHHFISLLRRLAIVILD